MKKILFVANVAKEHIMKFHIPSIKAFIDEGWIVDIACSGDEDIPFCNQQYHMCWERSPFSLKTFTEIRKLSNIINKGQYDVVYCHTPVGGFVARIASIRARKNGTKVIYFVHGFHFYKGAPLKNWLLYFPVERLLARLTDKMITINAEDYENAKNLLKKKDVIQIDGMGIELTSFLTADKAAERAKIRAELGISEDAWVLIYLAELIPNKNQKMLIDVLKQVCIKHPDTYLLLAGIDHYHGEIQRYAEMVGVENRIRCLGWRNDKVSLYASADICTPSSIREGFGLNLVEAMAMGLPVVATRNRGHKTIITEGCNGYLVDIDDTSAMSERIISIMTKTVSLKSSFENLQKYDQQAIVKRIIDYVSL